MTRTAGWEGNRWVYDLKVDPDVLLPEFRCPMATCHIMTDLWSTDPVLRIDTKDCRTYRDVFLLLVQASDDLWMNYEFEQIRFSSYNDQTGRADAEMEGWP